VVPPFARLLRDLRIPHFPLRVEEMVDDAFQTALTLRQAVAVVALRGDGKTEAARRVRERYAAMDADLLRRDPSARPLQIVGRAQPERRDRACRSPDDPPGRFAATRATA
jgi:hypothetical protein